MLFKKKRTIYQDRVEQKFQTVVDLIKDLDKKEFNRLQEGMQLAWEAYNKVRQAKGNEEKELEDIEDAERKLDNL